MSNWHHLALVFILVFYQPYLCSSYCPQGEYSIVQNSQQVCVAQATINAHIRPTPTNFMYMLVFEGGQVPFTNISDFTSSTQITIYSSFETLSSTSQSYLAQAITEDLSVIQITLLVNQIPYGTKMTVSFRDYSTDDTRASIIKGQVSLDLISYKEVTSSNSKLIDIIYDMDFILEIVWIIFSLMNPYWLLYMDCKLYRETLNLLKQVKVQYEPFISIFFASNDKKIAGIRVPNLFGMFVLGNDFASEWDKYPKNVLGRDPTNSKRIDDTKILADSRALQFHSYPLFLDNYGVELIILIGCLVLILICEAIFRLFKVDQNKNSFTKFLDKTKIFAWNFLLVNIIGSCQSMIFYTALQIQAFFSEKNSHNIINFASGIAVFVIIMAFLIGYLIWDSKRRTNEYFLNRILHVEIDPAIFNKKPLKFFGPILDCYKQDKLKYLMMIFLPIPRAIIFSVLILTLSSNPIAQTASMVGITVLFIELIILLVLAILDDSKNFGFSGRDGLGITLIVIWIAFPILTIIFGAVGIISYARQLYKQREATIKSSKVAPIKASKPKEAPKSEETKESKTTIITIDEKNEKTPKNTKENKVVPLPKPEKNKEETPKAAKDNKPVQKSEPKKEDIKEPSKEKEPTTTPKYRKVPPIAIPTASTQKDLVTQVSQPTNSSDTGRPLLNKSGNTTNTQNKSKKMGMSAILDKTADGQTTNRQRKNSLSDELAKDGEGRRPLLDSTKANNGLSKHALNNVGNGWVSNMEPRKVNGRQKKPFVPVELKLTADSMKYIDEKGFKDFFTSSHQNL